MKKNEYLHAIIKTMNQSEKRTFRMLAKEAGKKSKAYIELFEAMEKQLHYDEKALKKKLSKKPWINNFASTKKYLYKTMLKALRLANDEKGPRKKLMNHYQNFSILEKKGLDKVAMEELKKAEKIAVDELQSDSWSIILLSDKNNQLMSSKFAGLTEAEVDEFVMKPIHISEQYTRYLQYIALYHKMTFYAAKGGFRSAETQKGIARLAADPILRKDYKNLSYRTKVLYFDIQFFCCYAKGDFRTMARIAIESLRLVSVEIFNESKNGVLLTNLNNVLFSLSLAGSGVLIEQYRKEFTSLLDSFEKDKIIASKMAGRRYDAEFSSYLMWMPLHRKIDELKKLLPQAEQSLNRIFKQLSAQRQLALTFGLCRAHFACQNHEKTDVYIAKTRAHSNYKSHQRYLQAISVLELLNLYRQGRMELLSVQLKNTKALLKRRELYFPFERSCCTMLSRLCSPNQIGKEQQILEQYHARFKELSKVPSEIHAFIYTDIFLFIETQLESYNSDILKCPNALNIIPLDMEDLPVAMQGMGG